MHGFSMKGRRIGLEEWMYLPRLCLPLSSAPLSLGEKSIILPLMSEKKVTFFAAACFFLSAVEYALPRPLPFFRLGLANLPIMLSFAVLKKKESAILVLLKIFFQALIAGTLFSYIFVLSFLGTVFSALAMFLCYDILKKRGLISWIGVSVAGGFSSNLAQFFVSYLFIFGKNTRLVAPAMLFISLVTSVCLGIFSCIFEEKSYVFPILKESPAPPADEEIKTKKKSSHSIRSVLSIAFTIIAYIVIFFSRSLSVIYALLILFAVLVFIKKRCIKILPSIILIASITLFSLFTPYGRVVFSIGNFRITQGAVEAGLIKGGRLCAMLFISQFALSHHFSLPGKIGRIFSKTVSTTAKLKKAKVEKHSSLISEIDMRLLNAWEDKDEQ